MRHFQPFEAIVEAMKESTFLELCEDNTCVRRRDPLPSALNQGPDPDAIEIFEDKAMPRSVYVKGFGEEKPSTQFDIEHFFAEYGTTNAVRLRRSDDKTFKSSVFVEFDTEETAEKFLKLDPKPKFQEKDLQIMSKREYCDKKVEDIKAGKIRPNTQHQKPRRDHGGRDRDFRRKRDDEDDRDWRVRREEDRKGGYRDNKRRSRDDPDYTKGSRGSAKGKYEKAEVDDKSVPPCSLQTILTNAVGAFLSLRKPLQTIPRRSETKLPQTQSQMRKQQSMRTSRPKDSRMTTRSRLRAKKLAARREQGRTTKETRTEKSRKSTPRPKWRSNLDCYGLMIPTRYDRAISRAFRSRYLLGDCTGG